MHSTYTLKEREREREKKGKVKKEKGEWRKTKQLHKILEFLKNIYIWIDMYFQNVCFDDLIECVVYILWPLCFSFKGKKIERRWASFFLEQSGVLLSFEKSPVISQLIQKYIWGVFVIGLFTQYWNLLCFALICFETEHFRC